VKAPNRLLEYSVHAVTEGIDAQGEVTVRIQAEDGMQMTHAQRSHGLPRTFGGYGADTDIVVASVRAYMSALNKMLIAQGRRNSMVKKPNQAKVMVG
jgi:2-isopropylmalate synthase